MSLDLPVSSSSTHRWGSNSRVHYYLRCLAGFDYDFGCLNTDGTPNELNVALNTLFSGAGRANVLFRGLRLLFPGLQRIVGDVLGEAVQS